MLVLKNCGGVIIFSSIVHYLSCTILNSLKTIDSVITYMSYNSEVKIKSLYEMPERHEPQ